tara:strand:+ start:393 stop:539 length:147 start_codon:yes stop_codon:yes gene_type:complete
LALWFIALNGRNEINQVWKKGCRTGMRGNVAKKNVIKRERQNRSAKHK